MSSILNRKNTVLMVDDHEENLRVIAGILRTEGYDLMPANSSEKVFERLEVRTPDLILLDVVIPDVDGLEICRRLKKDPRWADIPVIFLSAADDKAIVVKALEAGGVDYIHKPFNAAELKSRVRTHLLLKQSRDDLASLAADKDELLRVMAHDFKNQVSGVLMSARLLEERAETATLNERSSKLIRNMRESSERMMGFLKTFLANQNARRHTVEVRPTLVADIIAECLAEISPSAQMKDTGIDYRNTTPESRAMLDPNAARQVLGNLLENAVKFCPRGSEIIIETSPPANGAIRIAVSDNGPGFTDADRTQIFKKYSRLSATPSGGEPSTGLGLYIARSLAIEMGGNIILADTPPRGGAHFILEFKSTD